MMRRLILLSLFISIAGCASAPAVPRVAGAYGDLGKAKLVLADDSRGAAADFTRAIELDPGNAPLYVLRGMSYRNLGDRQAAEADFKRAVSLDSGLEKAVRPFMP